MQITRQSLAWHDRFFNHVATAFPGLDFWAWAALGGWTNRYDVLALVAGEEILSTVARTRMVLSLADTETDRDTGLRHLREGLQLGAIATRRDCQGRGYARRLMQQVLQDAAQANHPVLLFSSEEAECFYPSFGFERVDTSRFHLPLTVTPDGSPPRRLDPQAAEDRRLLALAVSATPSHRGGLTARPDVSIILWYLVNSDIRALCLDDGDAVVLVEEEAETETLIIREWLGARPRDLRPVLPQLVSRPVARVVFGFCPPESWMGSDVVEEVDGRERLFIRGIGRLRTPLCFPDMLYT